MRNPSVMKYDAGQYASINTQRSVFDRSHSHKTTFDCDYLVPFVLEEALPGDTMNLQATIVARANTLLYPLMDNAYLNTYFFFVPNRLVWENWTKFMGEQLDPADSVDYTIPVCGDASIEAGSNKLGDYFGLPTGTTLTGISCLPFRGYYRIWNEWFRDENLQDTLTTGKSTSDGPETGALYGGCKKRNKGYDYFTGALPWPQKPNALGSEINMPLGTSATVQAGSSRLVSTCSDAMKLAYVGTDAYPASGKVLGVSGAGDVEDLVSPTVGTSGTIMYPTNLYADLESATAASISSVREAFLMQEMMEMEARGGTRYPEILVNMFGVYDPQHAVLQRPEFLGGGKSPVIFNAVTQQSQTDTTELGSLAATGTVVGNNHGFVKSFTEHGYVFGLVCVTADLTYQRGVDRHWSRETKYDFFFPPLQGLTEQAILYKEIYAGTGSDDDVFGYIGRYDEYRHARSKITGQLNSHYATSLDMRHLSQEFGSLPTLSSEFITCATPFDRCVATPSEPHFTMDSFINLKHVRPMSLRHRPATLNRF